MKANSTSPALKKSKGVNYGTASTVQLWSMCLIPMFFVFMFSYMPMAGIVLAFK